jgi:CspA family cold shock protein
LLKIAKEIPDIQHLRRPRYDSTEDFRFNDAKGYGFISPESGKEVFVHYSAIQVEVHKTLQQGQSVTMKLTDGAKGTQTDNLSPA